MKEEPKIINMVKFFSLCLLYEGPRYGYELITEISKKTGRKVSPGQIYPFLKKLEETGYIKSGKIGERDKKTYHITPDGRKLASKIFKRFGDIIDIAVEPRLTICAHCGCKIFSEGHKETIGGKPLAFCCCHCAESFKGDE